MDSSTRHLILQALVSVAGLAGVLSVILGATWFVIDVNATESIGIGVALGQVAMLLGALLLAVTVPALIGLRRHRRSGHVLAIVASVLVLPVGFIGSIFVPFPELGVLVHMLLLGYSVSIVVMAVMELGRPPRPAA